MKKTPPGPNAAVPDAAVTDAAQQTAAAAQDAVPHAAPAHAAVTHAACAAPPAAAQQAAVTHAATPQAVAVTHAAGLPADIAQTAAAQDAVTDAASPHASTAAAAAPPAATLAAFISLGSNVGDSAAVMRRALCLINGLDGVAVTAASRLYRTEPQGDPGQPWFTNQAARLDCRKDITPRSLLKSLLAIEDKLGRERDPKRRFGPRRIDLDLLLFANAVLAEPDLVLPHPRLRERAFALVPLAELDPDLALPCGAKVRALLEAIAHRVEGDKIFQ